MSQLKIDTTKKRSISSTVNLDKTSAEKPFKKRRINSSLFQSLDEKKNQASIILQREWLSLKRYQYHERPCYLLYLAENFQPEEINSLVKYLHHDTYIIVNDTLFYYDNWTRKIHANDIYPAITSSIKQHFQNDISVVKKEDDLAIMVKKNALLLGSDQLYFIANKVDNFIIILSIDDSINDSNFITDISKKNYNLPILIQKNNAIQYCFFDIETKDWQFKSLPLAMANVNFPFTAINVPTIVSKESLSPQLITAINNSSYGSNCSDILMLHNFRYEHYTTHHYHESPCSLTMKALTIKNLSNPISDYSNAIKTIAYELIASRAFVSNKVYHWSHETNLLLILYSGYFYGHKDLIKRGIGFKGNLMNDASDSENGDGNVICFCPFMVDKQLFENECSPTEKSSLVRLTIDLNYLSPLHTRGQYNQFFKIVDLSCSSFSYNVKITDRLSYLVKFSPDDGMQLTFTLDNKLFSTRLDLEECIFYGNSFEINKFCLFTLIKLINAANFKEPFEAYLTSLLDVSQNQEENLFTVRKILIALTQGLTICSEYNFNSKLKITTQLISDIYFARHQTLYTFNQVAEHNPSHGPEFFDKQPSSTLSNHYRKALIEVVNHSSHPNQPITIPRIMKETGHTINPEIVTNNYFETTIEDLPYQNLATNFLETRAAVNQVMHNGQSSRATYIITHQDIMDSAEQFIAGANCCK